MSGRRVLTCALWVVLVVLLGGPAAQADTGPWSWPLAGPPPVGRGFTPPETAYGAGHRGVDLLGDGGQPVLAAGAGTVSYAGLLAGRGVVVVVHGALRTTYEPVSWWVSVGEAVGLGEPLGTLETGHLGCPVAACLHWGLRRGEQYLDPLGLIERRPVRLLPLRDLARAGPVPQPPVDPDVTAAQRPASVTGADRPAAQPPAGGGWGPVAGWSAAALTVGGAAAAAGARARRR